MIHLSKKFSTKSQRPVEKIGKFFDIQPTTSQNLTTLHTSVAAETYVGGSLAICFARGSGTTVGNGSVVLVYQPKGSTIGNIDHVTGDIYTIPKNILWTIPVNFAASLAAEGITAFILTAKLKGMRKMSPGNKLVLIDIAQSSNLYRFSASIVAFFKQ